MWKENVELTIFPHTHTFAVGSNFEWLRSNKCSNVSKSVSQGPRVEGGFSSKFFPTNFVKKERALIPYFPCCFHMFPMFFHMPPMFPMVSLSDYHHLPTFHPPNLSQRVPALRGSSPHCAPSAWRPQSSASASWPRGTASWRQRRRCRASNSSRSLVGIWRFPLLDYRIFIYLFRIIGIISIIYGLSLLSMDLPKLLILKRIFPNKNQPFWGTPIYGNSHIAWDIIGQWDIIGIINSD